MDPFGQIQWSSVAKQRYRDSLVARGTRRTTMREQRYCQEEACPVDRYWIGIHPWGAG